MEQIHFKMETLKSAIDSMRPNCHFVAVDLSEAFLFNSDSTTIQKILSLYLSEQEVPIYISCIGFSFLPNGFNEGIKTYLC